MSDVPELHDHIGELERRSATAARLLDIRPIIGALSVVYGLIVPLAGLPAPPLPAATPPPASAAPAGRGYGRCSARSPCPPRSPGCPPPRRPGSAPRPRAG